MRKVAKGEVPSQKWEDDVSKLPTEVFGEDPLEGSLIQEWIKYKELLLQQGEQLDTLPFWKRYCRNLPFLFQKAKKYLCIPITNASLDRRCSMTRRVLTSQRSNLGPERYSSDMFNIGNAEFSGKYLDQLLLVHDANVAMMQSTDHIFPPSDDDWAKEFKESPDEESDCELERTVAASSAVQDESSSTSTSTRSHSVILRIDASKLNRSSTNNKT